MQKLLHGPLEGDQLCTRVKQFALVLADGCGEVPRGRCRRVHVDLKYRKQVRLTIPVKWNLRVFRQSQFAA